MKKLYPDKLCPICVGGTMLYETFTYLIKVNQENHLIEATGYHCQNCEESILEGDELEYFMDKIRHLFDWKEKE